MKQNIVLFYIVALISALCVVFVGCNDSNGIEQSGNERKRIEMAKLTDNIYYVAGSNAQSVFVQDYGTVKCGAYLLISKNLKDTVCVHNLMADMQPGKLFDGVFEFPAEIMPGNICGFTLFPEEYRYSYPVKINSHRPQTETEEMSNVSICNAMIAVSTIRPNKSIVIESFTKI